MNARDFFGRPEYRKLIAAVRARLEADGTDAKTVTLHDLDDAERGAIADLFGWTKRPELPVRISIERLDRVLRGSRLALGLVDVVEALGGPIVNRRANRDERRAAIDRMWRDAANHSAIAARPELGDLLDELRRSGILTRISNGDSARLLAQALDVVARLPASGVQRSVLAAELTTDPHSLDVGQPLATIVLRAAAKIAGWPRVPISSAATRRLWADVGVACDPLSADVLVYGLRPSGEDRLARHLYESARDGEPRRVTLRELLRSTLSIEAGTPIFVCENPGLVAEAADRLGAGSRALVCVDGMPSTAALTLLRRAKASGAVVRFHADFDWPGLRIANVLFAQLDAAPWRFRAGDYARAAEQRAEGVRLAGAPVHAAWDPELRSMMLNFDRAIFEEQLVTELLSDLAT